MAFRIYKPGQGYYTRVLTAVGAGTLVLAGIFWLGQQAWVQQSEYQFYLQGAIAVGMVLLFGGLLWYLLNKPRIADFLIATEAEMKKVNWPSRRELLGSTWVVICGAFMLAVWLFVFNIVFGWIFVQTGVLVDQ